MFYTHQGCPICIDGIVGFMGCDDESTVVLMCDECDAMWLHPRELNSENAIYPEPPEFVVPGRRCRVSTWASRNEIVTAGFSEFIRGETKALGES